MTTRPVGGSILQLQANAVPGDIVGYRLERVGFAEDAIYMPSDVETVVLPGGTVEPRNLWASAEGGRNLLCILPNGYTFAFSLQPGATLITLQELHALNSPLEPEVSPTIQNMLDAATTGPVLAFAAQLANTSDANLGAELVGYVGRTVRAKLAETVSLADYGPIVDLGVTLGAALAAHDAGTTYHLPPGEYNWTTTATVNKPSVISAYGTTINLLATGGKIRVDTDNVKILGATFVHTPNPGQQGGGNILGVKNTATGDVPGHHTGWEFRDCTFRNVTLRYQKLGRIGTRSSLLWTSLTTAIDTSDTDLPVSSAAGFTTLMQARVLLDNGVVEYRPITEADITPTPDIITVPTPFSFSAPEGRHVTAATLTNGAQGAVSTITIDTGTIFTDGQYGQFLQSNGSTHISQVLSHTATTVTIQDALTVGVADNASALAVNNGVGTTGTDIAGDSKIISCVFEHWRGNYACELGGVTNVEVSRNYWHDIVRYVDPLSPLYYTEYHTLDKTAEAALVNSSYGECLKVTANSRLIKIHDNTFERFVRDAVDLFAGGGASIRGNTCVDGLGIYSQFIESKWKSSDTTLPEPIIIAENTVLNMGGYGMVCGTPNTTISGNMIRYSGLSGLYLNGARDAIADDDTAELRNYTDAVTVTGNVIIDNNGSGILVTEVTKSAIVGNVLLRNAYNIFLNAGSARIAVIGNVCRDHDSGGQDIRIAGDPAVDSQHEIWANITDSMTGAVQLYDVNADYVVINGFGEEAGLLAAAQPTLTKWPIGAMVRNTTDSKVYLRGMTAWVALN